MGTKAIIFAVFSIRASLDGGQSYSWVSGSSIQASFAPKEFAQKIAAPAIYSRDVSPRWVTYRRGRQTELRTTSVDDRVCRLHRRAAALNGVVAHFFCWVSIFYAPYLAHLLGET